MPGLRKRNTLFKKPDPVESLVCQVSYIRSYASYPKEARDVFCFKKLHLGHVAKSYALRDPPTKITGLGKGNWVRSDERKRERKSALKVR